MPGSVGVLASAIDSLIDLVASILAYIAVFIADTPPDEDHPFGHGKFEDFAALLEAVLIMVGALVIVWEAISRLLHPAPVELQPIPGIIVMLIALILDFIVSRILFKIAKETHSSALYADAHHLSTDVWGSSAVIIGLIIVKLTGLEIFDPLVALVVAAMITKVGVEIIQQVFKHLVDTALPEEEETKIKEIIQSAIPNNHPTEVANLKTRRSGSHRTIVFDFRVPPDLTVEKAHAYCDDIEAALEKAYPASLINIHLEPIK